MSLSLYGDPIFVKGSFFSRSKVTTLHVEAHRVEPHASVYSLLAPIPHLHTLALKGYALYDGSVQEFLEQRSAGDDPLDPWPQPRNLYLISCRGKPEHVQQPVSIHPIQTLWVYDHALYQSGLWKSPEQRRKLVDLLSLSVPDVTCTNSCDLSPTRDWDFVRI
jgi:hypothetical protein